MSSSVLLPFYIFCWSNVSYRVLKESNGCWCCYFHVIHCAMYQPKILKDRWISFLFFFVLFLWLLFLSITFVHIFCFLTQRFLVGITVKIYDEQYWKILKQKKFSFLNQFFIFFLSYFIGRCSFFSHFTNKY